MELSLALGRPIGMMPEREFARWRRYASRRGLPMRRLEIYLAQIAMLIAQTMGGSTATLRDFLFDAEPEPEQIDVKALQEAFGYKPSKVRKRG